MRDNNPWWEGHSLPPLPSFRRWAFAPILKGIKKGLAPATVLRGPRQVGKTTLLNQVIEALLEEKVEPHRILRIQFDELPSLRGVSEPILELSRWFSENVLRESFNDAARKGKTAFVFLDEVQNLSDWAPQLKHLVDMHAVRVIVTGSSALRIMQGRDSLAGRTYSIDLGPLLLREIAELRKIGTFPQLPASNGVRHFIDAEFWRELQQIGLANIESRDAAFSAFAERGGYPLAQARADVSWEEIAEQLNETVIRRAIEHDLRAGARGQRRDPSLLEEVFRLACRYTGQSPGQAVFVDEIKSALAANIGWQRILAYLKFLDGTLLIKLVEPLELRLKRRRGARKICLCDHALRAGWLQEIIPLTPEGLVSSPHLADLAGHIAESIVGYFLGSVPDIELAHFPPRGAEPEVDFVITIGGKRIPLEVKYRQHIDPLRDTRGLRAFLEKSVYNAPFGLLVTLHDNVNIPDPRIIALPLSSLLLAR
ncbi:MAG: ATP-binding protein [Chloroflexi bacterium]|nr:ATP-binding protein [Chloroflexota bacterium]